MNSPKTPSRRRFLSHSLDLGLLAILTTTFAGRSLANEQKAGGGTITTMKGQVFVNGRKASQTTLIPTNAEVRTGQRSLVAFSAGGDAHVLKANTSIKLSSGSGGFTDQLRLLTGALLSAWGERPAGRQATMASGTATIGIRGTITFCTTGRFSLLEGAVEYTYVDKSGQSKTVSLTRDESGKAVSVDESGTVIDWVPPISREDVDALKAAIQQLASDGSNTQSLLQQLQKIENLLDELATRTESGELVIDVPPAASGAASPH